MPGVQGEGWDCQGRAGCLGALGNGCSSAKAGCQSIGGEREGKHLKNAVLSWQAQVEGITLGRSWRAQPRRHQAGLGDGAGNRGLPRRPRPRPKGRLRGGRAGRAGGASGGGGQPQPRRAGEARCVCAARPRLIIQRPRQEAAAGGERGAWGCGGVEAEALGKRGRSRAGARGAAAPRGPGPAALFTFQRGGVGLAASVAGPGPLLPAGLSALVTFSACRASPRPGGAGTAGGSWVDNGGGLFVGVTGGAAGSAPGSSSSPGGGQRPWAALAPRPSAQGGANAAVHSHLCAELP